MLGNIEGKNKINLEKIQYIKRRRRKKCEEEEEDEKEEKEELPPPEVSLSPVTPESLRGDPAIRYWVMLTRGQS